MLREVENVPHAIVTGDVAPLSDQTAIVTIHTDQHVGVIDPRIFGHFTEETLGSYEGGISSEMLFNRKFAMPEDRGGNDPLFPGVSGCWDPIGLGPGVTLVIDQRVCYSPTQSQRITYSGRDTPAGIEQRGYRKLRPPIEDPFRFSQASGTTSVWRSRTATCAERSMLRSVNPT
jgi:hypothetical protein